MLERSRVTGNKMFIIIPVHIALSVYITPYYQHLENEATSFENKYGPCKFEPEGDNRVRQTHGNSNKETGM